MFTFLLRRLLFAVLVMFCALIFVFVLSHTIPADPARQALGESAPEASVERYRQEHGLDQPAPVQFVRYLQRLVRGDLGKSIMTTRPVAEELRAGIPATIELVVPSLMFATVVGVALGIVSASNSGRSVDQMARVTSLFGMSMPVFWLGLVAQLIFFRWLGILPVGQRLSQQFQPPNHVTGFYTIDSLLMGDLRLFGDAVSHLILPVLVLSLDTMATLSRMTRASMLEVLRSDYVRTARGKGLKSTFVMLRHALPNSLTPIVTIVGLRFGAMMGGAIVVETIFAWPGLGRRAFQSLLSVDYPMVMGFTLWMVLAYGIANLMVDIAYPFIDPRIRES